MSNHHERVKKGSDFMFPSERENKMFDCGQRLKEKVCEESSSPFALSKYFLSSFLDERETLSAVKRPWLEGWILL